ncbi:GIY-YIG nuclease family protein [Croceiramulus getboli]
MVFYVYLLFSDSTNKYYVGSSHDPWCRLTSHNTSDRKTFTSKGRPWELKAIFKVGSDRGDAVKIERWIKKQKSRRLLEKLVDPDYIPEGRLAQLVRVPYVRD